MIEPKVSKVAKIVPSDPEDDPLAEVDYPGDIEGDAKAELDALQSGFRKRISQENDRFRRAVDVQYWTAVCFESKEQRNRFLDKLGLTEEGQYVDGVELAEKLGIDLD